MEDESKLVTETVSTTQPSRRIKRTEVLMDVTTLVKKKIIPAPNDTTESNVVAKGYQDTIKKTTEQLLKDQKELSDWTQLLEDLELEESNPGSGLLTEERKAALKKMINDNGNVSCF